MNQLEKSFYKILGKIMEKILLIFEIVPEFIRNNIERKFKMTTLQI